MHRQIGLLFRHALAIMFGVRTQVTGASFEQTGGRHATHGTRPLDFHSGPDVGLLPTVPCGRGMTLLKIERRVAGILPYFAGSDGTPPASSDDEPLFGLLLDSIGRPSSTAFLEDSSSSTMGACENFGTLRILATPVPREAPSP